MTKSTETHSSGRGLHLFSCAIADAKPAALPRALVSPAAWLIGADLPYRSDWRAALRNASVLPSNAPARSQVHGLSDAFGSRSIMFTAMMRASAPKKIPSRSDSANLQSRRRAETLSMRVVQTLPRNPQAKLPKGNYPTAVCNADIVSIFIEDATSSPSSPTEHDALRRPIQHLFLMIEAELKGVQLFLRFYTLLPLPCSWSAQGLQLAAMDSLRRLLLESLRSRSCSRGLANRARGIASTP